MDWIEQVLNSPSFNIAAFPAALVLGLLTAATSCCNVGVVAAVVGFAGSRDESSSRRDALAITIAFMLGTVVSLSLAGLVIGHFSGLAGTSLKRYGIALMAFAVIFAGLAALKLLPFRFPSLDWSKVKRPRGRFGSIIFGLVIGTASIACTMACCGPLLPLVFGMSAVKGEGIWGAVILGLFAIGYSIPLAALMLGVGLGRTTAFAQKAIKPIRLVAGSSLIVVGFWLLATM